MDLYEQSVVLLIDGVCFQIDGSVWGSVVSQVVT